MSESIWKKEITLRRKPAGNAPKESIWKKEISLRRKPSEKAPATSVDPVRNLEPWIGAPELPPEPVQPEPLAPEPVATFAPVQPLPAPGPQIAAVPPASQSEPAPPASVPVATFAAGPPEPAPTPVAQPSQSWPVSQPPEPKPEIPAEPELRQEAPPASQSEPEPPPFVPEPAPVAAFPAAQPDAESTIVLQPSQSWPVPQRPETEPAMQAEVETEEEAPQFNLEPPTSIWKKDISLRRVPRTPKPAARPTAKGGSHKVKKIVGLKIGASQLAAARVANNGAAELLFAAREPLEQGIVVNGELRDPDALVKALKSFFDRNKLPRKNVRLGIASNRIGVRIIDVAGIDDRKQLDNAIRFRAQEALPLPLDEAVLDYHVVGESIDEDGKPVRRVVLVVAYRELVERYVSACRRAGISLVGVDLEAFALLRALAAPRPDDADPDAAFVAVAIGHDRSTLAVSDGRVCEFTRVLEWGGAMLDNAVARALQIAPSDAEVVKRGLSLESNVAALNQHPAAVEALRKQVQSFARELVSALQFYQHQPHSLALGEVVITGGTAMLPGLADELQRLIGVRVRVGDPLARLKVGKKIRTDDQVGSLAVAIGLGIED